jgi:hypothetical protein
VYQSVQFEMKYEKERKGENEEENGKIRKIG